MEGDVRGVTCCNDGEEGSYSCIEKIYGIHGVCLQCSMGNNKNDNSIEELQSNIRNTHILKEKMHNT